MQYLSYLSAEQPKLIPQPREAHFTEEISLAGGVRVVALSTDPDDRFAALDLCKALSAVGCSDHTGPDAYVIRLRRADNQPVNDLLHERNLVFTDEMAKEGYIAILQKSGADVIAKTAEGIFYGAQTIKQLAAANGGKPAIWAGEIRDWPAMRYRGVSDDLSRGPIPTLAYQERQIQLFAAYKINLYSPYFENTLAYHAFPVVAPPEGALSAEDAKELVRFARQYHVTVVPEQESFGHLHKALVYEQYAELAETPHGQVLAPGEPGTIPYIQTMFQEIAKAFPGPFLHIGADETFDLGRGKTRERVTKEGMSKTYIDFLAQIRAALTPLNRKLLYWGDLVWNDPGHVADLPKDMIAVPWHYEPEAAGFDRFIAPFRKAGIETWVAPGVSNWSRVYPDSNQAFPNIQGFIRDGQKLGATGTLNTVWNDDGEGLFDSDWYPILFGAAASWQAGESSIPDFQNAYPEVFHGDRSGSIRQALQEIALAHNLLSQAGLEDGNDDLFWIDPWSARGKKIAEKIRPATHELRIHSERALALLIEAQRNPSLRERDAVAAMELGARRLDMIGMKFQLADEIARSYNRTYAGLNASKPSNPGLEMQEIVGPDGRCQDIMNAYATIRHLYEEAWRKENRPYWLGNVLARYDRAGNLWAQREQAASEALEQWYETHALPKPEEIGIPPVSPDSF